MSLHPVCPVCGAVLTMGEHSWACENRHSFDVARQGYVNLLTVDRKHSLHPGDTRDMVLARRELLDTGVYRPIADALCRLLGEYCPEAESILDAGCGEGYYLSRVEAAFPRAELWGVDISKDAVRYAAGRSKKARFLAGTAAALPFADGGADAVLSMFALTVGEEYARVLRDGGIFIQVLAGSEHLMGLKSIIYPEILRREKHQQEELPDFALLHHETLEFAFSLEDGRQVGNLLSMTPHFWRISREGAERLANTSRLDDRAQVVFNVYRAEKRGG